MLRSVTKIVHGVTAYSNGSCRCLECRKAWATYIRARRACRSRYYDARTAVTRVALTPLAQRILRAAAQRDGYDPGDVMEDLVRKHGPQHAFDETASTET